MRELLNGHFRQGLRVGYNAEMIVLAIDTCDLAGSVAIVRDRMVAGLAWHNTAEEYSSWLLPTVG